MGKTNELDEFRGTFDTLDNEIVRLLTERFLLSQKVGLYKKKNSIAIHDPSRERHILNKIEQVSQSEDIKVALVEVYKTLLAQSKILQSL